MNSCLFSGTISRISKKIISANGTQYIKLSISVPGRVYDATSKEYVPILDRVEVIAYGEVADRVDGYELGDKIIAECVYSGHIHDGGGIFTAKTIEAYDAPKKKWHASNWF